MSARQLTTRRNGAGFVTAFGHPRHRLRGMYTTSFERIAKLSRRYCAAGRFNSERVTEAGRTFCVSAARDDFMARIRAPGATIMTSSAETADTDTQTEE